MPAFDATGAENVDTVQTRSPSPRPIALIRGLRTSLVGIVSRNGRVSVLLECALDTPGIDADQSGRRLLPLGQNAEEAPDAVTAQLVA